MKAKPSGRRAVSASRSFRTDYGGINLGHCKSAESALVAAFRRIVIDRYSHCTIEGPDAVVARLRATPGGVTVWAPIPMQAPRVDPKRGRK